MENFNQKPLDLAVLIMSYDGFSDTWDACDKCFKKYWKTDYPVYLVTNSLKPEFEFIKTYGIQDRCYSEGINKFASECESKYILLLMADFLPCKTVDGAALKNLLVTLEREDADYCSVFRQRDKYKYYKQFKDYENLLEIDNGILYAVNVMPAIWKTSLLKKLTDNLQFNPWQFELAFQKQSPIKDVMDKCVNLYCKDEIYPLCHTVVKGKYTKDGVKFLKKENITVDYGKRKKMNFFENCKTSLADSMSRKSKDNIKKILKKFGFKFYAE